MKKIILFTLLVGLLVMAGCSSEEQGTWQKIEKEGKLVVGMSADYKPFEYHDKDDNIVGFDVDVLKEIAKKLNLELELKDTAWDGIIPGLQSSKYDLIMSAMTITEDRKKAVNFSDSYFNAGQIIAVSESNDSIKNVEDLKGKTVGVQLGTTADIEASKMEGVEVKRYEKIPQAFIELNNGRVDAVAADLPVVAKYTLDHSGVKIVGEPFTTENFGIAMRKADTELLEKINTALADLKADGTYDEIYNKWFK
ncbi:basic amino acid ABC transporter substrate-binding protein [Orenia marismortui]|uniref:Amino acid ABC transporter substrate-binding protein (PAAT family) n=1 Tax=Orenia marismortui TaxID=46469 RepID=A0A4R8H056_9FIRM|nr:basic amino acid ABC transporter substrate-binding protein [Orenia marismortui]TDX52447.1 amino acid ABC transporter substrate-binding protein (PAAT family) [Orenia marismortui]